MKRLTDSLAGEVTNDKSAVNHWPDLIKQFWSYLGRTPANDVRLWVVKEVANDGLYPKKVP